MYMFMNVRATAPPMDSSLTEPLPRLIRFVDSIPGGYLSVLDPVQNILLVDRHQYSQLSESDRHRVDKTRELHMKLV